jgi:hypothetical protein
LRFVGAVRCVEGRIGGCWTPRVVAGWRVARPRLWLGRCSGVWAFCARFVVLGLISFLAEVEWALDPHGAESQSPGHHAAF